LRRNGLVDIAGDRVRAAGVFFVTDPALAGGDGSLLPAMAEELRAYIAVPPPEPDPSDRTAVIDIVAPILVIR
jgi:hypothetical protein